MYNLRKFLFVECNINDLSKEFANICNVKHYHLHIYSEKGGSAYSSSINIVSLYILLMIDYLIFACILIIPTYIKYIFCYITKVYSNSKKDKEFNLQEKINTKLNALALTFIIIKPYSSASVLDSIVAWLAISTIIFGIPIIFIVISYFLLKKISYFLLKNIKINNTIITLILICSFPIIDWFIHYYVKIY